MGVEDPYVSKGWVQPLVSGSTDKRRLVIWSTPPLDVARRYLGDRRGGDHDETLQVGFGDRERRHQHAITSPSDG